MAKPTRKAVPTTRASRGATAPSHPPPPFLLMLEKAVKAVQAQKKEEDDKEKEKELIMEINRLKAAVEDVPVKEELIKLRDWVFREAASRAWYGDHSASRGMVIILD